MISSLRYHVCFPPIYKLVSGTIRIGHAVKGGRDGAWQSSASAGPTARSPGRLGRNGKPLGLAGWPGRRRKTKTISSSGGAIAQPARRRRSGRGHDRPGSLRHEAGGGVGHAVKGGRVKLAVRRQRRPDARSPRRNPNVMASRSLWPAGQVEVGKRKLSVVRVER